MTRLVSVVFLLALASPARCAATSASATMPAAGTVERATIAPAGTPPDRQPLSENVPDSAASPPTPLLLRQPAVSRTQLVFLYAGDLWIADRDGGEARRLTTTVGEETHPSFSPDGKWIAFTGAYDGNEDVYVVSAAGGEPRRLTFHPTQEIVVGWTPDGTSILFHSDAEDYYDELYTVTGAGGFPQKLPLGNGFEASFSPDGTHLAYVPHGSWQHAQKRYRGGQTTPIWIADLRDSSIEPIPRENSNDNDPMWVGNTIYFLSDRDGSVGLYAYDTQSKLVRRVVDSGGWDIKSASAASDVIVYEQIGSLHLYDLASKRSRSISVHPVGDLNEIRPHYVSVDAKSIQHFALSPSGTRALFEAWGEIFTVPVEKGDIRNLTRTPGVAERDPAWSPDGSMIACFSDASGEYNLELRNQTGIGEVRTIGLGTPPSYFYSPVWSPDGRKIAYADKRLNLWYVEVGKGKPIRVDSDIFEGSVFGQSWAPDSRWIVYQKLLPNRLHAIFVYSLAEGRSRQLTDGMSDALAPCFDRDGKYLYFTASTDAGLTASAQDMSSFSRPVTRSVYVAVLSAKLPSPLAPESDEEKPPAEANATAKPPAAHEKVEAAKVGIDFDGISRRILALPVAARNYGRLLPGASGVLFLGEAPIVSAGASSASSSLTLRKFDLKERKEEPFLEGIDDFTLSADGKKILYRKGDAWIVAGTESPPAAESAPNAGVGPLKMDAMQVTIDPPVMWRQIFHEVWRIERDFFYDPNHHGLDLKKLEQRYSPFLAGVASRSELTYVLADALAELSVGHMSVGGGEEPQPPQVNVGLLGADYAIENGRYRVKRVYDAENWSPDLTAPLSQPGIDVRPGDYILAVNGRELRGSGNIFAFFQNTAGKQVRLKVSSDPRGDQAHDVTVVPLENDVDLRRHAWMEANRRTVDRLTGGRVAYVYLPNTSRAGYADFNRYYFAQVGKEAVIIDERFNEGGKVADYIIDYLRRPLMCKVAAREGADWANPGEAIFGPKVMLINEMAGSGGDVLPWFFRKVGLGPLVGKTTWGGLVGVGNYPTLIDGGFVTAPRDAFYGLSGEWEIENHGVVPDYDVDQDPKLLREGHDPQLEKAVEVVLKLLRESPPPEHPRPAYPNYHKMDELGVK
jgi:tricorn protease